MKKIYQFTWNFKSYRSTDVWTLLLFQIDLDIVGLIDEVGESDTEIQLERVN